MVCAGVKILVAEDDDVERESLVELLRVWDYEARATSDGVEALKEIASSAFDLVVSDLYMPHMSGLELLKELRERFPSVPCIIVSGAEQQKLEAMRLGAWSFFKKPVDSEQLRASVRSCLDARRRNESTRRVFHPRLLCIINHHVWGRLRGGIRK